MYSHSCVSVAASSTVGFVGVTYLPWWRLMDSAPLLCLPYRTYDAILFNMLTPCGQVVLYGDINLVHLWFRQWLVVLEHQAITWMNVDFSLVKFSVIHLKAIPQWMPQRLFWEISFKMMLVIILPHLLETNDLKWYSVCCLYKPSW